MRMNFSQFQYQLTMVQGDAIDLSQSKYMGEREPIVVQCTRCGFTYAVERAGDLLDENKPTACPLCRERREHLQRMNRIRLKENNRLRSALQLISIL